MPVPAVVTRVVRASGGGGAWSWRVGPVELDHEVTASAGGGCVVSTTIRAPRLLEPVIALAYGPVVALLMRNLARVAAGPPPR